jgi:hypothetical protein
MSYPDNEPLKVYSWRIKDETSPWRNKRKPWRELTWKMTEEDAAAYGRKHALDIQRVEGSEEIRPPVGETQGMVIGRKSSG